MSTLREIGDSNDAARALDAAAPLLRLASARAWYDVRDRMFHLRMVREGLLIDSRADEDTFLNEDLLRILLQDMIARLDIAILNKAA